LKIKVANTAGFCKGVKRAMNIVLDTANRKKKNIYTYGPLIHNPQAVELLESKNVKIVNDISEISSGTVIIRTHGISPEIKKGIEESGANIYDATCPDVMKVQYLIKRYSERGYFIVIVGDRGHPEVIAHLGFSNGKGIVVDSLEELDQIPEREKICVVVQTTYNHDRFQEIANIIQKRFPQSEIYNTICDATFKRQKEVREICEEVDCMVIVGGRNSGNTIRLVKIAESTGTPTIHVETEEEIDEEKLSRFNFIGISAGASTPNWLIQKVIDRIEGIKERKKEKTPLLTHGLKLLVRANIYVALGAGFLTYATSLLQGINPVSETFFISSLYVFSMHVLNRFTDRTAGRFNDPARIKFYERHSRVLIISGIVSIAISLFIASKLGFIPFIILLASCLLGIFYSIKLIPKGWKKIKYKRLKDIPASKDIFIALAWSTVTVILPFMADKKGVFLPMIISFLFAFFVVLIRAIIFDLRDIQGDRIVGRETLPIIIGENKAENIILGLGAIVGFTLIISIFFHWVSSLGWLFCISIIYIFFYLYLYKKRMFAQRLSWETIIDGNFVLLGLVAFLWNSLYQSPFSLY